MDGFEKGRAWIELDMAALRHNAALLQSRLPEGCRLMPAVKANAYGHGAALIAGELQRLCVNAFCVATAREGAELRRAGIKGDILVLGYTHPMDAEILQENDLIQTVVDGDYAAELSSAGFKLRTHLAIDSGMHRLGVKCGDIGLMERICRMEMLSVEGAFTHLCTGDAEFSALQARRFYSAVSALRGRGLKLSKTHILSSYGLLDHPEFGGDYARTGIAVYGLLSTREDLMQRGTDLRPVLSLKARVVSVRKLKCGEGAGYGLCFRADSSRRIAALSIGYADGLPGALGNARGRVLINGAYAPMIGRMCMDQTLVDVTEVPEVKAGDEAVLIGSSGALALSAYDMAESAGLITNELLSRLGARLNRVPV